MKWLQMFLFTINNSIKLHIWLIKQFYVKQLNLALVIYLYTV